MLTCDICGGDSILFAGSKGWCIDHVSDGVVATVKTAQAALKAHGRSAVGVTEVLRHADLTEEEG